jgi:hypothetical protein
MVSLVLTVGHRKNNASTSILFHISTVVTGLDTLLGKIYNSLGLSSSQNDVQICSRRMETQRDDLNIFQVFMHVFIRPGP